MFDIGWTELALIGVVALVVIGPKDLPKAMYMVGKWLRRARLMARDFQSGMDEMMRQAELDELRQEVAKARAFNVRDQVTNLIDPDGGLRAATKIEDRLEPLDLPADPVPTAVAAMAGTETKSDLESASLPAGQPISPLSPIEPATVAALAAIDDKRG
jgi:sec-independent protein translocase protein TatB